MHLESLMLGGWEVSISGGARTWSIWETQYIVHQLFDLAERLAPSC